MKTIVFIGGRANAGKTTLIRNSGLPFLSTSQILDHFTANYIRISGIDDFTPIPTLINKLQKKETINGQNPRLLKIKCAEDLIVPVLGRDALVRAAFKLARNNPVTLFESIGGDELQIAKSIAEEKNYLTCGINIRHKNELIGVDIRSLIRAEPGMQVDEFWPVRNTIDDQVEFKKLIDSLVS